MYRCQSRQNLTGEQDTCSPSQSQPSPSLCYCVFNRNMQWTTVSCMLWGDFPVKEKAQCSHNCAVQGKHWQCSCHGSSSRSHAAETMTIFYKAGRMFPQCQGQRKHCLWPCPPPQPFLNSPHSMQVYTGAYKVTSFPPNVKFVSTVGREQKNCFTKYSKIFCQRGNCQLPTFTSLSSGFLSYSAEHSPGALLKCNWQ